MLSEYRMSTGPMVAKTMALGALERRMGSLEGRDPTSSHLVGRLTKERSMYAIVTSVHVDHPDDRAPGIVRGY